MNAICKKHFWVLLFALTLLAIIVRVWNLDRMSYFDNYDEYYTAKIVFGLNEETISDQSIVEVAKIQSRSLSDVAKDAMRDNGNSFSYNFILHYFCEIFGQTNFVLRIFSVLCDVVSLMCIMSIGRALKMSSQRVLLACLLFAVFPLHALVASVVRTYAFTTAITLLLVRVIITADRQSRMILPTTMIAVLASMLFLGHYLSYYVLVVISVFLFCFRKHLSQHFKVVAIGFGAAAIVCFSFLFLNYSGIVNFNHRNQNFKELALNQQNKTAKLKPHLLPLSASTFVFKSMLYCNAYYMGSRIVEKKATQYFGNKGLFVSALVCFALLFVVFWNLPLRKENRWPILFVSLFVAGNLSATALSLIAGHTLSFNVKYTMFSVPFYLMAVSFFMHFNRYSKATVLFILVVSLYSLQMNLDKGGGNFIPVMIERTNGYRQYTGIDNYEMMNDLWNQINTSDSDTLYVKTEEDLIFIKCAIPELTHTYAYILANDKNRTFASKVVGVSFSTPK